MNFPMNPTSNSDMWNKRLPIGVGPPLPPPQGAIFPPPPQNSNQQHIRMMGLPPSILGYPGNSPIIPGLQPPPPNNMQQQPQQQRSFIINSYQCWILFQLINIVSKYV